MAIVKILQYPDPRLKRVAKPVPEVNDHIRSIVADMFETHYASKNCAALANTQLDFPEAWQITVIDFSEKKNEPLCLINPNIIEKHGKMDEEEGCMSVAAQGAKLYSDLYESVRRAAEIKVQYLDEQGREHTMSADGFMAKCIQHEVDHLHGRLFIDHLSRLKRARLLKRLNRIREMER
jgi:peptide deformylase